MKFHHATIATLTTVVQFLVLSHTKIAHAITMADTTETGDDNDSSNTGSIALFKYDFVNLPTHFATRSLEENDTCSNACKDGSVSSLAAAFQSDTYKQVGDGGGSVSGFFGRIIGFFSNTKSIFGRFMNNILNIFTKRDDEKYMIPTDKILPLLSNYSSKFNSLAKMLREESMNDATISTPPDLVQLMYNISADSMESIATILDPIMDEMRQQDTMHIRDMSCRMMHIVSIVRDETLPNIERVAQVLYTKSNNATMKDAFDKYTGTKTSTKLNNSTQSKRQDTCSMYPWYDSFTAKLPICNIDSGCGVIGSIISVITLLLLIPITLVVGILYAIFSYIMGVVLIFTSPEEASNSFYAAFVSLGYFAGVVVFLIVLISINIIDIVNMLFEPFLSSSSQSSTQLQQTNDIMYRLSDVLKSPLGTISDLLRDQNNFSKMKQDKKDAIDCEVSVLTCKNHALVEALPF
jgi:hypothetical protein